MFQNQTLNNSVLHVYVHNKSNYTFYKMECWYQIRVWYNLIVATNFLVTFSRFVVNLSIFLLLLLFLAQFSWDKTLFPSVIKRNNRHHKKTSKPWRSYLKDMNQFRYQLLFLLFLSMRILRQVVHHINKNMHFYLWKQCSIWK